MNIVIKRIRVRPETIDGHLYIDGTKICDTAENATGALPEGEYQIHIQKCKQYSKNVLRLEAATLSNPVRSAGVTKPESEIWLEASTRCDRCQKLEFVCNNTTMPVYCPMLKPGNGVHNRLDGSIILGTRIIPGCLKHPKQAFDAVYGRIRKSIERGNQVTVTIKNESV